MYLTHACNLMCPPHTTLRSSIRRKKFQINLYVLKNVQANEQPWIVNWNYICSNAS